MIGNPLAGKTSSSGAELIIGFLLASDPRLFLASELPKPRPKRRAKKEGK